MLVNTSDWFDGVRMCKKGEPYTGDRKTGHFKEVEGKEKESLKEYPLRYAIKKALESFDHEDDKIWTNAGLPVVKEVEKMIGQTVGRDQIEDSFPGFRRDTTPLSKQKSITP